MSATRVPRKRTTIAAALVFVALSGTIVAGDALADEGPRLECVDGEAVLSYASTPGLEATADGLAFLPTTAANVERYLDPTVRHTATVKSDGETFYLALPACR